MNATVRFCGSSYDSKLQMSIRSFCREESVDKKTMYSASVARRSISKGIAVTGDLKYFIVNSSDVP